MHKKTRLCIALTLITLGIFPLISVLVVYAIADLAGCTVNEASVQPCVLLSLDIGEFLYTFAMMGWLFLATWPVLLIGVVWAALELLLHIIRRPH